jgi:hypothetical protein
MDVLEVVLALARRGAPERTDIDIASTEKLVSAILRRTVFLMKGPMKF